MEIDHAISIASEEFPRGAEEVARRLGILVEYTPLRGCEGWCINKGGSYFVRINSSSCLERQRFTLAHELAHILLFSTPDVSTEGCSEEQAVNHIAACILLPHEKVRDLLGAERPISPSTVGDVCRIAEVSRMMVARRIVTLAKELEIDPAYTAHATNGKIIWTFPPDACPETRSLQIISDADKQGGSIRYERRNVKFAADLFKTQWSTTLLVQRYT